MPSRPRPAQVSAKTAYPPIAIPEELKSKVNIAMQQVRSNQPVEALALYTEILTASQICSQSLSNGKALPADQGPLQGNCGISPQPSASPRVCRSVFPALLSPLRIRFHPEPLPIAPRRSTERRAAGIHYYRGLAYTALRTGTKPPRT